MNLATSWLLNIVVYLSCDINKMLMAITVQKNNTSINGASYCSSLMKKLCGKEKSSSLKISASSSSGFWHTVEHSTVSTLALSIKS